MQAALCCPCGSLSIKRRGLCRRCLRRAKLSREKFGGQRELAIERDRGCIVCGEPEPARLVVHHRRRGINDVRHFRTLCRRCHPRVHFLARLRYGLPAALRTLWREQHPGQAEQLELKLEAPPTLAEQTALF